MLALLEFVISAVAFQRNGIKTLYYIRVHPRRCTNRLVSTRDFLLTISELLQCERNRKFFSQLSRPVQWLEDCGSPGHHNVV